MTASPTHIKSPTWQQVDSDQSNLHKENTDEHSESVDGNCHLEHNHKGDTMSNEQRIRDQHNYIRQLHDAVYHKEQARQHRYAALRKQQAQARRRLNTQDDGSAPDRVTSCKTIKARTETQ